MYWSLDFISHQIPFQKIQISLNYKYIDSIELLGKVVIFNDSDKNLMHIEL
jgi:hypothetical protein